MSLAVLVDYDSGNLHSAEKAFQRMALEVGGGEVIVSSHPEDVARADRIVLPGDGAFPACRAALGSYGGLYEASAEAVTWFVETVFPHIRVRYPNSRFMSQPFRPPLALP